MDWIIVAEALSLGIGAIVAGISASRTRYARVHLHLPKLVSHTSGHCRRYLEGPMDANEVIRPA